jgi:protein gp37
MGDRTGIQWTDATWNPMTGCTEVSAGCDNCYAATMARTRLRHVYLVHPALRNGGRANDPFAPRYWPDRLDQPRRWRKPRRVFVNSMSDLFHSHFTLDMIRAVFDVMAATPRHSYQVLTKRPERVARLAEQLPWPENVWLGTSIESMEVAGRLDHLRRVPAKVRFISAEPLLGPLDRLTLAGIDWVIGGGESGLGHRPVNPAWARGLRDAAEAANVPFFWKQWGGPTPKAQGRLLDGRLWSEFPERPAT